MDRIELVEFLECYALVVLEALTLINNEDFPTWLLLEDPVEIGTHTKRLVRSDDDVERVELILDDALPSTSIPEEGNDVKPRSPALNLPNPVRDGGVRDHN